MSPWENRELWRWGIAIPACAGIAFGIYVVVPALKAWGWLW